LYYIQVLMLKQDAGQKVRVRHVRPYHTKQKSDTSSNIINYHWDTRWKST
jgi:hypothetical protein